MVAGILLYYVISAFRLETETEQSLYYAISHYAQPYLIFTMLFLSFLKVEVTELRPHGWHLTLLITQASLFIVCSLAAMAVGNANESVKIVVEGAMLSFICPTATAVAVLVPKLGGKISGAVTYQILCNLMVTLVAPAFLPLVEPHGGLDFQTEFFMIMGKVFPLLLCPLFFAMIVRHYLPRLTEKLLSCRDLAFYLWLVALPLALTVTMRTIMESHAAVSLLVALAVVSLICCIIQFALGKFIGYKMNNGDDPHSNSVTAGQCFGQKNTVVIIWMGLVFLNPLTSVVGGFYAIWHNLINSWQLYRAK